MINTNYLTTNYNSLPVMGTIQNPKKGLKGSQTWNIVQDNNNFKLYSVKTKKIYEGPYNVVRHFDKNQLTIQMKNNKGRTVAFPVTCSNKEEVSAFYKLIKKTSGYTKLQLILKALEEQFISNILKNIR